MTRRAHWRIVQTATLVGALGAVGSAAANGENVTRYQRADGRVETYYAAGSTPLMQGLAAADGPMSFPWFAANPHLARDGMDEFVPIQLKRWNNNAAIALMRNLTTSFLGARSPRNLVPTGLAGYERVSDFPASDIQNTTNLRYADYAAQLLAWADDATTRNQLRAVADAFVTYFTPAQGSGFVNRVKVDTGQPLSQTIPILAVNWGLAIRGMGSLAAQFGTPGYWTWAKPRLDLAWNTRPNPNVNLLGDVYNSLGFCLPALLDDQSEVINWADTDTLYLLRTAYAGARQASDHQAMVNLEKVAQQWYTAGWLSDYAHGSRKLSHATGAAHPDHRIYSDGMYNYLFALSALYRMTGDPLVMERMEDLWDTFLAVSPNGSGLTVSGLHEGQPDQDQDGHVLIDGGQSSMLDALVDAYLATGSQTLLQDAQGLAAAMFAQNPPEAARDSTARPFFQLAEAVHGAIGRLEVNLGTTAGRVLIRNASNVQVFPVLNHPVVLPSHSAVIYLPLGTYRVELTQAGGATRPVVVPLTSAGVKIDYLTGAGATSFITGTIVQDNNDNGVLDASDTVSATGARAYIDANNNGRFDNGETNQINTGTGFVLPVSAGQRTVRAALPTGVTGRWTMPSGPLVGGSPGHTIQFFSGGLSVTPGAFGFTVKKRISGVVFHDKNGDAIKNGADRFLTDSIVYLDLSNDGTRNLGEPFAATAPDGSYSIGNLASGGTLRIVRRSAIPTLTRPPGGSQIVSLTTSGQHVTARDFGVR